MTFDFRKTNHLTKIILGVWLSSGAKGKNRSGYYVHIARAGSFIAGGFYCPEAEDLKKVRKEIAYFHEDLEEIIKNKNFQKEFGDFDRNETNLLKNPPRGYEKDHPAIEFLKLKSFETSQKFDFDEVLKEDFVCQNDQKINRFETLERFHQSGVNFRR